MKDAWQNLVIQKICFAMYVPRGTGGTVHKNRPYHGFVLNDADSVKEYCFSDGRVLRTEGGALFYLPKGSTYRVKNIQEGGCYAINFDAEIDAPLFSLKLKNTEILRKSFQISCAEWTRQSPMCHAAAMRALYEAMLEVLRETTAAYLPNSKSDLIAPAVEEIKRHFTDPELTVSHLSALCGMSEVYFRKIFSARFHTSPKEYIVQRRMEYAQGLLALGELEVHEVARLCGYTEPCHFSREFKKRFGVSPRGYRG